jgi:hypothetical protein
MYQRTTTCDPIFVTRGCENYSEIEGRMTVTVLARGKWKFYKCVERFRRKQINVNDEHSGWSTVTCVEVKKQISISGTTKESVLTFFVCQSHTCNTAQTGHSYVSQCKTQMQTL